METFAQNFEYFHIDVKQWFVKTPKIQLNFSLAVISLNQKHTLSNTWYAILALILKLFVIQN